MKVRLSKYTLSAFVGLLAMFSSQVSLGADKISNLCKPQGKIASYDDIFPSDMLSLKKHSANDNFYIYYVSDFEGFDQSPFINIYAQELCKIENFDQDFDDLIAGISTSDFMLHRKSPDLVERFSSAKFPNGKIGFVQFTTKTGYTQGWIFHDGRTRVSMIAFMYRDSDLAIVKRQIEEILGRVPDAPMIMETPK